MPWRRTGDDPFRILIATILSLRTRDTVTSVVSPKLFARADTPEAILALPREELREIIRPVGFYNNKNRYDPQDMPAIIIPL